MRTWRILLITTCIGLAAGCRKEGGTQARVGPPQTQSAASVLDQHFLRDDVQARVRVAEQDLPRDKWITNRVGTWNMTRGDREGNLANELLSELQPKFHEMSVSGLFSTLKTYPAMSDLVLTGVASDYFVYGNWRVIDELKKRPRRDLDWLRQHTNDTRQLYQENGPYGSVGMLCQVILDEAEGKVVTQELTNGLSR
jgi:hypothetical protein